MDLDSHTDWRCVFCGAEEVRRTHTGLFHPLRKRHGPFDFYICTACGSGLTLPPPSQESLMDLYGSFVSGLPEFHRQISSDDPQIGITEFCVRRLAELSRRRADENFRWVDIGAGGGELAVAMMKRFPNSEGVAVDLHHRPRSLEGISSVQWIRANINTADFASEIGSQADVVFAIGVWEHVTSPGEFVENLIRLLAKPGLLYLLTPNYGSLTRKILHDSWPYFTPGEHLFMPTPRGARDCLKRAWTLVQGADDGVLIDARPKMLPYTFRYVARRLRIPGGRFIPRGWRMPVPDGELEAFLTVGM